MKVSILSSAGIPVSVYKSSNVRENPPILVYFHGGGNVLGSRQAVDTTCKMLSEYVIIHIILVSKIYTHTLIIVMRFPLNISDYQLTKITASGEGVNIMLQHFNGEHAI